jgi:hypothetical protein
MKRVGRSELLRCHGGQPPRQIGRRQPRRRSTRRPDVCHARPHAISSGVFRADVSPIPRAGACGRADHGATDDDRPAPHRARSDPWAAVRLSSDVVPAPAIGLGTGSHRSDGATVVDSSAFWTLRLRDAPRGRRPFGHQVQGGCATADAWDRSASGARGDGDRRCRWGAWWGPPVCAPTRRPAHHFGPFAQRRRGSCPSAAWAGDAVDGAGS